MFEYNSRTVKPISDVKTYPQGANHPTIIVKYPCPCGKGIIEYGRVPGFDDEYVIIRCKECDEKYQVRSGWGYDWELIEK